MLFRQRYVCCEVLCSNYVIIIVEMILIQNLDYSKTVSMLFVFEIWSMTAPTKTWEFIPS